MTFSDWRKKRKNRQVDLQETTSEPQTTAKTTAQPTQKQPATPSFEEWTRTQQDKQRQTELRSAWSDKPKSFDEWTRKQNGDEAWRDEEAGYNDFLSRLNQYSQKAAGSQDTGYQTAEQAQKYRYDTNKALDELAQQAREYRNFFTANRDRYDEDRANKIFESLDSGDSYLSGARENANQQEAFWKQFQSEDEYNNWKKWQEYEALRGNSDFAEKSQYKSTKNGEGLGSRVLYGSSGYNDVLYDAINGDSIAQNRLYTSNDPRRYDYTQISDETKALFNYIYATQGDVAAYKYLDGAVGQRYDGIDAIGYGALQGSGALSLAAGIGGAAAAIGGSEERDHYKEAYGSYLKDAQGAMSQHKTAYTLGSIGGNLALMTALGGATGAAGKAAGSVAATGAAKIGAERAAAYITGKAVGQAVSNGLTFMAADAVRNSGAYVTGNMDSGDFWKSLGVSGSQGLANGLAGGLIQSGMAYELAKTGNMTNFAEFVRQTVAGTASATAGTAVGYALREDKPDSAQVATDLATAFAFSLIQGAISTAQATATNRSAMETAVEGIQRRYNEMSSGWNSMTPEQRAATAEAIRIETDNLRNMLHSRYIAGQQSTVNQLDSALDLIDGGMRNYLNGFRTATGAAAASYDGNLLGGTTYDSTGAAESAEIAAQMQAAVEQGLSIAQPETGGPVQSSVDTNAINLPAATVQTGTGSEALARAAQEVANGGAVTNSMAQGILTDPTAVATLERAAGLQISDDMSQAQARKAVKAAVEALASRQEEAIPPSGEITPAPVEPRQEGTQTAQRTAAIMAQDTKAVSDFAATMGKAGETALTKMYDPQTRADSYIRGMVDYYNAGAQGLDFDKVQTTGSLAEPQKEAAYLAGNADADSNIVNGGQNYGTAEEPAEVYLRNGSQRDNGTDSGGELRAVEGGAGQNPGWHVETQPADAGAAALSYGQEVSTASLGFSGGLEDDAIHLVTGGDTEATSAARSLAESRGLEVTFFGGGNLSIRREDGGIASARAAYVDGNRLYVRADHPEFTAEQLTRHEVGHDMLEKGEIDRGKTMARARQLLGDRRFQESIDQYEAAYRESGLTPEDVRDEVICDSLGGMNIFHGISGMEETAQNILDASFVATEEQKRANGTRGPPEGNVKLSRDMNERNRALRKGEMVNEFRDKVNWPRYYKKILSEEYNPDHYEDGETAFMYLDGDRLTLQMQRNGEWSVVGMERANNAGSYGISTDGDRASDAEKNGRTRVPGKREGNSIRNDSGRAGSGGGVGRSSGQGRNDQRNGEGGAADHSEAHAVKTKFSMETPVEETKDLVALHNLTEDKLLKSISLGGFPMPSIAVTRQDIPHTNFGDITLVMDKGAIDPKASRKNTVYSADAWTPTVPRVEYEADPKAEQRITTKLDQLGEKLDKHFRDSLHHVSYGMDELLNRYDGEAGVIEHAMENYGMKAAFLEEQGQHIDPITKQVEEDPGYSESRVEKYENVAKVLGTRDPNEIGSMTMKEIRDQYGAELEQAFPGMTKSPFRMSGILNQVRAYLNAESGQVAYKTVTDTKAMERAVDEALDKPKYERWVRDLFSGLEGNSGVYNNKERFTPSGNRRSFQQTHYPATLDGITKAMAGQNGGDSRNVSGFYGVKSLRAGMAERFRDIADMHQAEGRLQNLTQAQLDKIQDNLNNRLSDLTSRIIATNPIGSYIQQADAVGNILMEVAEGKLHTIDEIERVFNKEYQYHVGNELSADVRNLLFDVSQMPVNMFEAKPERAVGFDEVLAAVVPDNASEKLVDALGEKGVRVIPYEAGNDTDRIQKVNSVEGAKFSQDLPELENLRKENKRLQAQVESWKGQLKRTTPENRTVRQKDVDKLAKRLISAYDSTLDTAEVSADLKKLGEYIVRGGDGKNELTWDAVHDSALTIGRKLVENALAADDSAYKAYTELRKYLRDTKITIGPEYAGDIPDFKAFKDSYKGKLRLSLGDKTNVDQVYQELSENWPELFSEAGEAHPTDQILRISDVLDGLTPIYENPHSYDMDRAAEYAAGDILDSIMGEDVRQKPPTFADKQARKLEDAVARERVEKDAAVAEEREKRSDTILAERMAAGRAIAKERTIRDQKLQALKDHYAEIQDRRRERREDSNARTRLLKIAKRLQNKKLPAVNRALLDQYIGDLDTAAKSMTGKTLENLIELQSWYTEQKENNPDFIADPNVEKALSRLQKRQISSLTANEVRELTDVLLNIENEIRTQRKLIDSQDRRDVYHMGQDVIRDVYNTKGSEGGFLDTHLVTETLSPVRQIRRMTGYVDTDPLYVLTQGLADGQRDMMAYQMRSSRPFEKFANDKKFNERFSGKKAEKIEIRGVTIQGQDVKVNITPAMRVSLYLHSLNDDNLRHIAGGGITIPDEKFYRKGDMGEAYARGVTIRMTPSEIRAITSKMTDQERSFAKAVQKYFNEDSKPALNEVSEKLKGYPVAEVENYFPINTDPNFTRSEFESIKQDGTIEGMGFLKERVVAKNPILLRDANDVVDQAIRMHGKYVGLAIPVRNFNKVWNVTTTAYGEDGNSAYPTGSVQSAIESRWGETGTKYVDKLMGDLQGSTQTKNVWAKALNNVRSNYARAVLTLNLSVAMKQAASYPTAAAVLGWKPLAQAMKDFGKVDLSLIEKYTPLQWYRSKGFSTKELGDMKSGGKSLPQGLNWVQGVDLITTRKLWKASEYYVRDYQKNLAVGSDEYYKAVAQIYNRVIEETQPNYTIMQRPQLLRSDDTLMGNLAMFKTQPFQNTGIVYDAVGNYLAKAEQAKYGGEKAKAEAKAARRNMGWAITSQLGQLAVFAGMTLVWALARGKKDKYEDEDGNLTAGSVLSAVGKDMVGGALSGIPFGSDAWELVSSKLFGDKYYGLDAVTVTAIQDTLEAMNSLTDQLGRIGKAALTGGEINWNSERLKLDTELDSFSKAVGVPYENVLNLGKVVVRQTVVRALGQNVGEYAYLKLTTDPEKYPSDYYDVLYKAMGDNQEDYEKIYQDMLDFGFDEDKIRNAIEKRMKEDQGVKNVSDLDHRYLSPAQEESWNGVYDGLSGSRLWGSATEAQRDAVEDKLYNVVTQNSAGEKLREKIDGGAAYGLDETEYMLYLLALSMADKPTESGKMGSYTNDEVAEAIRMVPGLTDEERSYLWTAQGKSDKSNPWG